MELWVTVVMAFLILPAVVVESKIRHYNFTVVSKNFTKLCSTKPILTVNGKFPGPTLYAREGDRVLVRVINHAQHNVTIHWHGVRQLGTCWSDGPAYITQCPIQPGQSYMYNFTISGQRGTLLWHAHISWLRATLHGAIVMKPKRGTPYPFPTPDKEKIIILGSPSTGTLALFPIALSVLLRIINAAVNDEMFFKIAGHQLTVVEVDASYTKPFSTETLFLAPGQTTTALLTADQPHSKYTIAASTFMDAPIAVDNLTNYALLRYSSSTSPPGLSAVPTSMPPLNATSAQFNFTSSLRSLNSPAFPARVPLSIDHDLFFAVGVGVNPCATCTNGTHLVGVINNVTFVMPTASSILQAHYYGVAGVFTDDFPGRPPQVFNYTGNLTALNLASNNGTRVYRLGFNSTVQIVLQDTAAIAPESHPIHLHGFNFYVVGTGMGNFDPVEDPKGFNLVDPVERNTIDAPTAGWTAIRFRSDNPGVWFLHCHLEVHTSWGLKMAFMVEDGEGLNQSLFPPPQDLPQC